MEGFFATKVGGQYRDEVRKCWYDILARNVGVWNVRPVITSVLQMGGLEVRDLPSIGLLSEMLVELKHISQLHVADELQGEAAATLHSDGTSKFGRKYGSYQISTKDRTLSWDCRNEVWHRRAYPRRRHFSATSMRAAKV